MLRRANCRSFFPQLAQWRLEMGRWSRQVCQKVGLSVTIALRHMGRLPCGALSFEEVPYGVDVGGW
eukprot:512506-Alexandrium_andersonii.AAC.1